MTTLAQARAMQAKKKAAKGVVQSPLAALQAQAVAAAAAQQGDPRKMTLDQLEAKVQQKKAEKAQRPKGILGAVLGNPVVKNALIPLQVLDTARRGVVAGAEEIGDAATGHGFSGKDWLEHVKDPGYGAGHLVAKAGGTGNDWLDRTIGFVGDAAADPFTYLTLGGSRVPGLAGRAAMAETAARQGGHLGEAGLNDLVERIAKSGVHNLSADERAMLGIEQAGVKFAGKRIPGTSEIANVLGKSGSRVRGAVADTAIGRGLRAMGTGRSPEIRAAVEKLATGRGEGTLADAASTIHLRNVGKGEERLFESAHTPLVRQTRKAVKHNANIVHEIEAGVQSVDTAAGRKALADLRQHAMDAGVEMGDLGPTYVPHYRTSALKDFLGKVKSNLPMKDTLDSSSGRTLARSWKGKWEVAGKEVDFGSGTIREVTDALHGAFPKELGGKKLFEDDFGNILAHYTQDLGKDVGKARTLLTGLETSPHAVRPISDVSVEVPVGQPKKVVNQVDVAFGKQSEQAAQKDFWTSAAHVRRAQEDAGNAVATLMEDQGLDGQALRDLVGQPNPNKVKATLASMDDTERKIMDAVDALPDYKHPDLQPTLKVIADYTKVKSTLGPKADTVFQAKDFLSEAKKGTFNQEIKLQLKDGWKAVGGDVLKGDVAVTETVAKAMENIYKSLDTNKFWQAVDAYTKFFKSYATMTPGFQVRNAMDSTFKNIADGVELGSIKDGIGLWRKFRANPQAPFSEVERDALTAVHRAGSGGQFSLTELGLEHGASGGRVSRAVQKATHNKLTETSAAAMEKVEGSVRAGMALDTLRNGGSIEEAVARIRRVHFDYSDVNELDRMMRRLIPFWTFMSRNVPLQVQQMWLKPNLYLKWQSLQRNFDMQDPNAVIPTAIAQRNGVMLGDGSPGSWAFTPDLSQNRLWSDVLAFQDPQRLLSNANPALRVPAELLAHRNFYNDYPLDPNHFEKADKEMALLRLLGVTDKAGNGDNVVDSRIPYALRNLLPPLAMAQRATGSGGSYRDGQPYNYYMDDGKPLSSALSFLGVPFQQVTKAAVTRQKGKDTKAASTKGDDAKAKALRNFGKG